MGVPLPYDKLSEVRGRLHEMSPTFTHIGEAEEAGFFDVASKGEKVFKG